MSMNVPKLRSINADINVLIHLQAIIAIAIKVTSFSPMEKHAQTLMNA
jgi:hypothetical protein